MSLHAMRAPWRTKIPLYVRVTLGAALGVALGSWHGSSPKPFWLDPSTLADAGLSVVRILKLVATPLILFSVVEAILASELRAKSAARLLGFSIMNATMALLIALGCGHLLHAGTAELGRLLGNPVRGTSSPLELPDPSATSWLPASLLDPFTKNSVLGVALVGVVFSLALRVVRQQTSEDARRVELAAAVSKVGQQACLVVLGWVIELIPLAVAGVVAGAVARTGAAALRGLLPFMATMIFGLLLQGLGYYGLVIAVGARRSPLGTLRGLADALLTALSCGSSAATLPVTLECLRRLGVRPASAQLAAAAGTNLNHDGIILYEAAATLFVAQALGLHLTPFEQLRVAGASVLAGIGMAGVPEAGLITLPVVLAAGGIPAPAIPAVVGLILPVDWIIGRFRAATNVASDATVAILLDRFNRDPASK